MGILFSLFDFAGICCLKFVKEGEIKSSFAIGGEVHRVQGYGGEGRGGRFVKGGEEVQLLEWVGNLMLWYGSVFVAEVRWVDNYCVIGN